MCGVRGERGCSAGYVFFGGRFSPRNMYMNMLTHTQTLGPLGQGRFLFSGEEGANLEGLDDPRALALPAAQQPGNVRAAPLGENTDRQRSKELEFTDDAVASPPPAGAARASTQGEGLDRDRVAAFENLRVCDPGVGHVRVDAGAAVPPGSGAGTAGDGLWRASAWGEWE